MYHPSDNDGVQCGIHKKMRGKDDYINLSNPPPKSAFSVQHSPNYHTSFTTVQQKPTKSQTTSHHGSLLLHYCLYARFPLQFLFATIRHVGHASLRRLLINTRLLRLRLRLLFLWLRLMQQVNSSSHHALDAYLRPAASNSIFASSSGHEGQDGLGLCIGRSNLLVMTR